MYNEYRTAPGNVGLSGLTSIPLPMYTIWSQRIILISAFVNLICIPDTIPEVFTHRNLLQTINPAFYFEQSYVRLKPATFSCSTTTKSVVVQLLIIFTHSKNLLPRNLSDSCLREEGWVYYDPPLPLKTLTLYTYPHKWALP